MMHACTHAWRDNCSYGNVKEYRKTAFSRNIFPFQCPFFSLKKCKTNLVVPGSFVALLKSVCAKLVGANSVKQEFVNASFWSGLPAKFRSRKKKVKISFIPRKKKRKNV